MHIGPIQIAIIIVIIVMLFGRKNIASLGSKLGRGIRKSKQRDIKQKSMTDKVDDCEDKRTTNK